MLMLQDLLFITFKGMDYHKQKFFDFFSKIN